MRVEREKEQKEELGGRWEASELSEDKTDYVEYAK